MEVGSVMMLTLDLQPGHYAIVCNLPGHYAAGMHQDFWVTPTGSTPVTATLSDASSTQMSRSLRVNKDGAIQRITICRATMLIQTALRTMATP